jgi:hypothetical protein
MPNQFVVPQFIDSEDKIFGPITSRQFVILLAAFVIEFLFFRFLSFTMFLLLGVPFIMLAGIVAFVKINGSPFHYFMLNVIQTIKRPSIRVWRREYSNSELLELMKKEPVLASSKFVRKEFAATSRLQELALVVNTGGIYKPDEK